jgi:hypothetical protein
MNRGVPSQTFRKRNICGFSGEPIKLRQTNALNSSRECYETRKQSIIPSGDISTDFDPPLLNEERAFCENG